MRRILLLSLVCLLAPAARGHAQLPDDNWARCRDKNPEVAVTGCSAVIRANERSTADLVTAYQNRAAAEARRGDRRSAIADYSAAIALEPNSAALHVGRGLSERALGDLDAAIHDYSTAIAIDPSAAPPYVSRGFAEADQGALDAAIADYNPALERDARYAFAYADRGVALAGAGDVDGASADFRTAIEINPRYAFAYTNLGNVKRAKGDTAGAAAEYAHALAVDSRFALAYFNRGVLEFNGRDFESALMDFRHAIDVDASTEVADQARLYEWIIRARRGEREDATHALTARLSERASQYIDAWSLRRMEFLAGSIDEDAILAAVRTPSDLRPVVLARRRAQAYFLVGIMRSLAGDSQNARKFLGESMSSDQTPESPYLSAAAELNVDRH